MKKTLLTITISTLIFLTAVSSFGQSGKVKSPTVEAVSIFGSEIGRIEKETDPFKSEIKLKLTNTTLSPDVVFALEVNKEKEAMSDFTKDALADSTPVIMRFYIRNQPKPVTLNQDTEVNFLADGQPVRGGKLRDAGDLFKSFKSSGIDDPRLMTTIGTLKQLGRAKTVKAKIAGTVYDVPGQALAQIRAFVAEYFK